MTLLARAASTRFYSGRVAADAEWRAISPTHRSELVQDQLANLPYGTRRISGSGTPVRAGTSGSGDDLLVLAWSEHELALERRAGARMLARIGIAPATPIANTLAGALVSPGSLLFGDVVEEHGALDVPLGAIESDTAAKQAWELVDRVSPAVLCLEGSTAPRFVAAAPSASRPWLKGILWLRRAAGTSAPAEIPAAVGFAGWQRIWLAIPEAASFAASSCARGALHADEQLRIELEDGVLLVTPLEGETALLKYDTGVRARMSDCACGAPSGFQLEE